MRYLLGSWIATVSLTSDYAVGGVSEFLDLNMPVAQRGDHILNETSRRIDPIEGTTGPNRISPHNDARIPERVDPAYVAPIEACHRLTKRLDVLL
jgi:hypothetical protein